MNKPITYGRQSIDEEDIRAVVEVLRSDFITQGPKVALFEEALASACKASYAVLFSSGTAALHGAYHGARLGPGDEFITSANTFLATANAGVFLGANPVFADVEPDTGNMSLSGLDHLVTGKTRLIVPVHYAGHPVDREGVWAFAQQHGLKVVEDACHALGAGYLPHEAGQGGGSVSPVGDCQWSHMTVFSFHPVKAITTGEGGAVTTNDRSLYETLRTFREHGVVRRREEFTCTPHGDWYYEMPFPGCNYRMTDIQAALGISQLKKLNAFITERRRIVALYDRLFAGNPFFDTPKERPYSLSAWHLYALRLKDRVKDQKAAIFSTLRQQGVGVQVHYIPVYLQPYYRNLGFSSGLCPQAEDFYHRQLTIPLYPGLSTEDVEYMAGKILSVMEENSREVKKRSVILP